MVVSRVTRGEPLLVRTGDGAELALWRAFRTAGQLALRHVPVLLVHGTFSDRHFFGGRHGLAQFLADRGHDAWVAELRGRRPFGKRDSGWTFEDWIVRDAPALLDALQSATGSPKALWVGHSAGAVIGIGCAARAPAHAAMLAGIVALAAPAPFAPGPVHTLAAVLGHAVGKSLGRFPARALRIGPADEPPGVLGQWCGWNAGGHWIGRDGFDYRAGARRVTTPVVGFAGGGDLLAPPAACARLLDGLGSTDTSLVVCGRAQGFSRNYTHNRLVVSSAARQEVWPLLAHWMNERFA